KVRMAIMSLDLDVEIRPCPPGGTRFRPEAEALGVAEPPLLIDAAFDVTIADPDGIVAHLRKHYGPGGDGPDTASAAPGALELFSYETCPFCAFVRDALSKQELPYTLRSMAPGSPKRDGFRAHYGKTQFPFLRDAVTGTELFESADIVRHLRTRHGV